MERKIYNKPFMVREQFLPQDFVAACTVFLPVEKVGTDFWIDLVHSDGYNYTIGPDGKADEQNVEHLLLYLVFQMLPFMLVVVDICGSLMETMD